MSVLITDRFFWNIDSSQRKSGTDSQFTYEIPFPPDVKFQYVVVKDALLPKSYWLISNKANHFFLKEGGTEVQIDIPVGNYLLQAFRQTIQNLLNANSPNGWVYTMSYPNMGTGTNTGKWVWTVSGNTSQPELRFTTHCYKQFGAKINSSIVFSGNTATSTNVINMQVQQNINLRTNLIKDKQGILETLHGSATVDYGMIEYECDDAYFYAHEMIIPNVQIPSFSITEPNGNLLDMNGNDVNFTLEFFNVSKIYDKIDNFMKLYILEKELESQKLGNGEWENIKENYFDDNENNNNNPIK